MYKINGLHNLDLKKRIKNGSEVKWVYNIF